MSTKPVQSETIECPLCLGKGDLLRTEVLERLGMRDFARVAQLSAEEAFRLLLKRHEQEQQTTWARFESELAKRTTEIERKHNIELQTVRARLAAADQIRMAEVQRVRTDLEGKLISEQGQHADLSRRMQDALREINELRQRNQTLESEMAKVARVGKREELDFAEEVQTWPGVAISEKLSRNGDYILSFRDPSGAAIEPRLLIDNKDKAVISETDIDKLVRDCKERSIAVAALVTRDANQLRAADRNTRWACKDGIWVLRTTRLWLPRDLDALKPLFDHMRVHGSDFLQRNTAVAEQVRRTFSDLDRIDKELGKAAKAVETASGLTLRYRARLQTLCEEAALPKEGVVGRMRKNIGE